MSTSPTKRIGIIAADSKDPKASRKATKVKILTPLLLFSKNFIKKIRQRVIKVVDKSV